MLSKTVLLRAGQYGNCEENPDTLGVALEVTQGTFGARLGEVSNLGHSALPSVFCTIDKGSSQVLGSCCKQSLVSLRLKLVGTLVGFC